MRGPQFLLWIACLAGCGGSEGVSTETCGVAGLTRQCLETCDYGTQTCLLTGDWSDCVCNEGSGAAIGGGTSGTTAGTTGGTGNTAGTIAADSGAGGNGGAQDGGIDGSMHHDAAVEVDATVMDSGPTGPGIYERCTKTDTCQDGTMCNRSGLGGTMSGICTKKCSSKADCPAPADGSATTACSGNGVCQLVCSVAVNCPAGLACVNLGAIGLCL